MADGRPSMTLLCRTQLFVDQDMWGVRFQIAAAIEVKSFAGDLGDLVEALNIPTSIGANAGLVLAFRTNSAYPTFSAVVNGNTLFSLRFCSRDSDCGDSAICAGLEGMSFCLTLSDCTHACTDRPNTQEAGHQWQHYMQGQ